MFLYCVSIEGCSPIDQANELRGFRRTEGHTTCTRTHTHTRANVRYSRNGKDKNHYFTCEFPHVLMISIRYEFHFFLLISNVIFTSIYLMTIVKNKTEKN